MPLLDGESGCVSEAGSSVDHVLWLDSGSVYGAFVKVDSAGLLGDDARNMLRFQRIAWSPSGYMHCVRLQVCAQAQGLAHLLRGSSREVDSLWR